MFFQKLKLKCLTLNQLLANDTTSSFFLAKFQSLEKNEDKIKLIQGLIDEDQFDFIVKLAHLSEDFKKFCSLPLFHPIWVSCWSTYGIVLRRDKNGALYDEPRVKEKFDLFLGIYFYRKALAFSCSSGIQDLSDEMQYLKKAMHYGSIHACQRYAQVLYQQIDTMQCDNPGKELSNIITNIKMLVPAHGSYAYLMLVEAFVRLAVHFKETKTVADKAFASAVKACEMAAQASKTKEDEYHIYNASLGRGLAASNTFALSDFTEIRQLISQCQQAMPNSTHYGLHEDSQTPQIQSVGPGSCF